MPAGSAGGLAAALHPQLEGSGATWVACAMSDADRMATDRRAHDRAGAASSLTVQPDPDTYRMAYDVVSNSTLWFFHHHLFDLARRPRFERHWSRGLGGLPRRQRLFAPVVAEAADEGATVLIQDYHLSLVPGILAEKRPDLQTVHFTHTPFADPDMLPGPAHRLWPASSWRAWRRPPPAASTRRVGSRPSGLLRGHGRRTCATPSCLRSPPTPSTWSSGPPHRNAWPAGERLEELLAGRRMVLRVDRIEPAKNLLRGFWAFDEMLRMRPELRGKVVMLALAYTSR